MVIKNENCCPCGYCEHFKPFEYQNEYFTIRKGYCQKHNSIKNPDDMLCDDFILMSGVYTKKWYPKNELNI